MRRSVAVAMSVVTASGMRIGNRQEAMVLGGSESGGGRA